MCMKWTTQYTMNVAYIYQIHIHIYLHKIKWWERKQEIIQTALTFVVYVMLVMSMMKEDGDMLRMDIVVGRVCCWYIIIIIIRDIYGTINEITDSI